MVDAKNIIPMSSAKGSAPVDVSNVTFDEAQPAEVLKLGLHALQGGAGMQTRATVPQVVAWIRALPDAAASEFWSLTCDLPLHSWSWASAAHAPTPADRLVEHVKSQPEEVRLAVLNGAFGGSLTAAIVADAEAETAKQRQRATDAERERDALRDQTFGDGVAIKRLEERVEQAERYRDLWKLRAEQAERAISEQTTATTEQIHGVVEAVLNAVAGPPSAGPVAMLDAMARKVQEAEKELVAAKRTIDDLNRALSRDVRRRDYYVVGDGVRRIAVRGTTKDGAVLLEWRGSVL